MWEESQAENTKLRLELSGVRSDLETARHQLDGAEKRVRPLSGQWGLFTYCYDNMTWN